MSNIHVLYLPITTEIVKFVKKLLVAILQVLANSNVKSLEPLGIQFLYLLKEPQI